MLMLLGVIIILFMTDVLSPYDAKLVGTGRRLTIADANGVVGHDENKWKWETNTFAKRVGDELHFTKLSNRITLVSGTRKKGVRLVENGKRAVNIKRAQTNLRNSIVHNWPARTLDRRFPVFLTFTYKGALTNYAQVENRREHIKDLMFFLRKLKARFPAVDFQYKWVYELQKQNGRMAGHFHMLVFNMPWNDVRELQSFWSRGCAPGEILGNLDVERAKKRHGAAWYMASYVGKGFEDMSVLFASHLYGGSDNLRDIESSTHADVVSAWLANAAMTGAWLKYEGKVFDIPYWGVEAQFFVYGT